MRLQDLFPENSDIGVAGVELADNMMKIRIKKSSQIFRVKKSKLIFLFVQGPEEISYVKSYSGCAVVFGKGEQMCVKSYVNLVTSV